MFKGISIVGLYQRHMNPSLAQVYNSLVGYPIGDVSVCIILQRQPEGDEDPGVLRSALKLNIIRQRHVHSFD